MAAAKGVCFVYLVLISYGICHGSRVLDEENGKKGSNDNGARMINGEDNGANVRSADSDPDSGDISANDFRFRGIIGGWGGLPGFDTPDFGFPGFGIPGFGIGGGIDIDFSDSDDSNVGNSKTGTTGGGEAINGQDDEHKHEGRENKHNYHGNDHHPDESEHEKLKY